MTDGSNSNWLTACGVTHEWHLDLVSSYDKMTYRKKASLA